MDLETPLTRQLKSLKLLGNVSNVLDLGSGVGHESIPLASLGVKVTAVDKKEDALEKLKNFKGDLDIEIVQSDILDFDIKPNTFDLIIAKNVLPFIHNKEDVINLIKNIVEKIKNGGVIYFTLFGPKDAWATEKKGTMSFFEYEEGIKILTDLGLKHIHRSTEEGLGTTMAGDIKYWHIHKFLYQKP